ncbi:FimV/HubP family polar landmark protein [Caenimonas aquaedulcis]
MGAQKPMTKPQWRATALAIAAAALLGVSTSTAYALGLGRITVQSALGEPLRAEIDVPEINAEEIASLRTAVASPEAFRAAGFEFNPTLSGIVITLQRRPDGRHFLQLSSNRAVNDPFVDLILETTWSSGRIVRDYTMLFDPPALRSNAAPLAAQVTPAAPSTRAPAPAPAPSARAPSVAPAAPAARAPAERPAPAAASRAPSGDGKQVTVQAGDTAGKIAAANKPASVSLDQMLVAMLRANPDAFIGGNINRLRAGAVVTVPTTEDANLIPPDDAKQTLVAQSRDFNEFRRRLAEGLPTTNVAPADRQSSGKIQAQVQEKKPGASAPDKLTLSKGAVQGKAAEDKIARERSAKDAAARVAELNKNIADLNRLSAASGPAGAGASGARPGVGVPVAGAASSAGKPASAAASAPAAKPASAPAMVTATAPASAAKPASAPAAAASAPVAASASAARPASAAPAVVAAPSPVASSASPMATVSPPSASAAVASASPASSAASAPVAMPSSVSASAAASSPASSAAAPASAPAPATVAAASAPKPSAVPRKAETSFLDDLLENPMVPAAIGGILAFLLGFGFYRAQQRKKSTQVDSSFLESRLQPDSFFGASGGQRIDTNEGNATGSSMVYSPSQLDAAGDVDPVAEADVYLAYGRDLQAEEILKEALRTNPQRVAVHSKLLEIYSKRRDNKAFELVATEAYGLTHGEGPVWEHICELGHELDATNPLYRPGGAPAEGAVAAAAAATAAGAAFSATSAQQATQGSQATQPVAAAPVDLDLDLDFDLDSPAEAPAAAPAAPVMGAYAPAPAPQPTLAMTVPPAPAGSDAMPPLDMDFGSASTVSMTSAPTEPAHLESPAADDNALSFDLDAPPPASPPPAAAPVAAAPAADSSGMIEFDLGSLSLDLPGATPAPAASAAAAATPAAAAKGLPEIDSGPSSRSGESTAGFEDSASGDPLATKFALAQEFNAIGDPDGARSLAQEVVAEASGDLKSKAQKFLAEIG